MVVNLLICGVATIDFKNKKLGVFVEDIKKVSYNIIDILEKRDYANGSLVIDINYDINLDEDKAVLYLD